MKPKKIKENKSFVGRVYELKRLAEIGAKKESSIIVTYGRRRIGKTELMEQAFRNRNIIKFEGIEGLPEKKQMERVMDQFSLYTQDPLYAKITIKSWGEFFKLLADKLTKGVWTLYFEEVQWLADYKDTFISELKKRSPREVTDAYLTVGGIPEYLKWINKESSMFLGLCKHSFTSGSFFSHEYERIFTSSIV